MAFHVIKLVCPSCLLSGQCPP